MSPGCQIDGKARHEWLDNEIEMEFGDTGTLHDVIAPYGEWIECKSAGALLNL